MKKDIKNQKYMKLKDSIAFYDNFISPELCDRFIEIFEQEKEMKAYDRFSTENTPVIHKQDLAITFSKNNNWPFELEEICKAMREMLKYYDQKTGYSNFACVRDLHFTNIKIQKTEPSGGYHVWHVEKYHRELGCKRALVWTVYLNDIKKGGETEFLYQKQRIEAKKGRACIFPSDFPYVHRGNPPLQGEKYILTSWFLSS